MEVPSPQDLLVFKRSTHLTVQDWISVLAPSYNESASKSQSRAAAHSKINQNISTENQCWFITKNKIKLRSLRGKKCLLSPVNCLFCPSHVLQLSLSGLTSHFSLPCSPKCLCQRQGQEGKLCLWNGWSAYRSQQTLWEVKLGRFIIKRNPTFFHNPKLSLKDQSGVGGNKVIPPFQMGHYLHSPLLACTCLLSMWSVWTASNSNTIHKQHTCNTRLCCNMGMKQSIPDYI